MVAGLDQGHQLFVMESARKTAMGNNRGGFTRFESNFSSG
jgi:hypothetical protein